MPKPDELSFSVKQSLVVGSMVGAAAIGAGCNQDTIVNSAPRVDRKDAGPVADVEDDAGDAEDPGDVDTGADDADVVSDTEGDGFDGSSCPDGAVCNPVPDTVGDDAESSDAESDDGGGDATDT